MLEENRGCCCGSQNLPFSYVIVITKPIFPSQSSFNFQRVCFSVLYLLCLLALSKDANWVITGSNDCTLKLWNLELCQVTQIFYEHLKPITCVALADDNSFAVSGKDHSIILLYKVKMQYVQVLNIVDTSIKHQISGQSTPMVKGCMHIC